MAAISRVSTCHLSFYCHLLFARYNSLSIGGNKEARDLHQRLNEGQV